MSTQCRFERCGWSGSVNDVFSHCEAAHPTYIREHKGKNYYDFAFDDVSEDAYLLCGPSGIYWFSTSEKTNTRDEIYRGVFHIGDSEPITYTLKFGLNRDGLVEHLGPFTSHSAETSQNHDVEISYDYLQYICEDIETRKMRLYVGEFDDSVDVLEEDEELNKECVEYLPCIVCNESIKRDIRFCANTHCLCLKCFKSMRERGKLRCPLCFTGYPFHCSDVDLDRYVSMVRFSDNVSQRRGDEKRPRVGG